jgi:3-hydroxyisobutyrate dehydrogenase
MQVAFIGLGTMGAHMAKNILKAGFGLTVHNRTRERELPLEDLGAKRAATPAQAAAEADIIIVCLSDTPDVEGVVLGPGGVIEGAKPGSLLVDMSTISPVATKAMAQTLAEKGIKMLDAPVSGGSEGAQKATLAVMIGGDEDQVQRAMPVLEAMGKTITHVGPNGAGQLTKVINQIVISSVYMGVAEGVVLGLKAGLDVEKVVEAIAGGAAGSWVLSNRAQNMIDNNYPLGFRMSLHHKDLNIALETAKSFGLEVPLTELAEKAASDLLAWGYADEDSSAFARCYRKSVGLE